MSIENKLLEYMVAELDMSRDALSPGYRLIESRVIDSLGLLQIVGYIENEFDIEVFDEEIVPENFDSVEAIARLVETKLRAHELRPVDR